MASNVKTSPPIAIVGIGLRLPGGISTTEQFWNLLIDKKDGRCRVPVDRYNVDAFHGDKNHQQKVASQHGYFLDHVNLKHFDAAFFSAKRNEVEVTDPQQRLLLEVVWECLESAGQTNLRGSRTGVYVGAFGEDWHNLLHRDEQTQSAYRVLSAGDYALANRLSYEFDFRGPSMTIRTACSASLTGFHLACQALQNGDCESAVVAGSSLIMDPSMTMDMSQQGVLSTDGICKTFDAAANGFARGEAMNAVLLKPLDQALRDGDPIRAVVRSSLVNSDGRTSHMGSPSTESQEELIRKAYEAAGITDFSQTAFFECHGTGTAVGDPLEVAAVANVFGESGIYVGSVKPNVGHGEGASGLTSIIKAVLSLENETIPPNVHFSTPNPKIPFDKFKLEVPQDAVPWPKDREARVSVNSFGIGGANAHVILDSAASFGVAPSSRVGNVTTNAALPAINGQAPHSREDGEIPVSPTKSNGVRWPHILPISANSIKSLQGRIDDTRRYIEAHPASFDDLAFTLGLRRKHLPHRSYCIVEDGLIDSLSFSSAEKVSRSSSVNGKIAFVFTGQGAQWHGMAKGLILGSPAFRESIREMDKALQELSDPPSWTIEAFLSSEHKDSAMVYQAEYSQTICSAIQLAMVDFLAKCGILPFAVVGHSSGEIAAAYASGALTLSQAILCAHFRGQAMKTVGRTGAMAAVGLSSETVQQYLVDGAQIACINSPTSVTISGDSTSVDQSLESIKQKESEAFTRLLHVNMAYHSDHMLEVGAAYEDKLTQHLPKQLPEPKIPVYSTVSGKLATAKHSFDAAYWRRNLESTVQFNDAVGGLLTDAPDLRTFLEIGPHSALQGPLRQIFQDKRDGKSLPTYIPTLIRDSDAIVSILHSLGHLYECGHDIDFSFINPPGSVLSDLPTYPWDHGEEYWNESRVSNAWRNRKHPHHELLGSICPEASELQPMWRNIFHESDVPWLRDHRVGTDVVFPCAAYIAMMGEALRQTSPSSSESFMLRNLMIKAALVLPEMEAIEIMTTIRPKRVTELSTSKDWYEISICTFNGSVWVENCTAEGRSRDSEKEVDIPKRTIQHQKRQIASGYFYDRMAYLGLRYGPRFQGLKNISADTHEYVATAEMSHDKSQNEANYAVHPTIIDYCLQLYAVAGCRGIARHMDTLALPIDIRQITINPGGPDLIAEAKLDLANTTASVVAISKDTQEIAVSLEHTKGIPFDTGDKEDRKESYDLSRLEWLPHIDYIPPGHLIRRRENRTNLRVLGEMITILCMLQTLDTVDSLDIQVSGHLAKYVAWLRTEKNIMIQGERELIVPEAMSWAISRPEERADLLESKMQELEALGDKTSVDVAKLGYDAAKRENVEALLNGTLNPLESLMTDDRLGSYYRLGSDSINTDEFFHLYAHANPSMKVLEIGGGTGSTTEQILPALMSRESVRMYSRYTFTDISPGFCNSAKEQFKAHQGLDFKILDIEKDPAEQGFELGSFDLIIASNVFHATSSLKNTLLKTRSLLRNGGCLYLAELLKPSCPAGSDFSSGRLPGFISGRLSGWWLGEADGRGDVPYISASRWDKELREAGFSGTDCVVLDDDAPYYFSAHMISRAVTETKNPESVAFLYMHERPEFGLQLSQLYEQAGVAVHWRRLGENTECPQVAHTISVLDLEGPFLNEISETNYNNFMGYLSELKGGVLWLTRPAQVGCTDPGYGIVNGLARTIRVELAIDFWLLELHELSPKALQASMSVCERFCNRDPLKHGVDTEFVVRDGIINISRFHWSSLTKALESDVQENAPKQMVIEQYGLLNSMQWVQQQQQQPGTLKDDDVEVDIRCVGLNFKDIMIAMGIVPRPKDSLGVEATGVVKRVGPAVKHIQVNDRVFVAGSGLFATQKILSGHSVFKLPDHHSFEQGASMPVVYATALYAVVKVGQLEKGQSILIHSGTGGVGQAAINLCQSIGAEIYVTVGSDEKAQYLVDHHNVPRERIFDSHSTSFLENVMKATAGRGVDVVLNSLSGELLHASWSCVAKYGKMLEIGQRDLLEHGSLALDMFQFNRSYHGIDLQSLLDERPEILRKLFEELLDMSFKKAAKPIEPIHTFSANEISEALRFMTKGQHIGKIIIKMPEEPKSIVSTKAKEMPLLSDKATYLVVGGLGGLGKSVTRWMVERGARNFCFLSRSAGQSDKDKAFLAELESQACTAVAVPGSVAEMDDVRKAINLSPSSIAGILQMSMVIRDRPALQTTYEDWRLVHDCKVMGTWNLHNAFLGKDLDFFILMSSISGCVGHPGQTNYTSANSFLDSFAQYREGLGLPCSVIDLGGMEGVGFLSERPAKLNQYRSFGLHILHEQHLVDAVQLAITCPKPPSNEVITGCYNSFTNSNQYVIGLNTSKPMSDPTNRALFRGDPRVQLYNTISSSEQNVNGGRDEGMREFLSQAEANPAMLDEPETLQRVSWEIGRALFSFLLLPEENLDISLTLVSIGIDSLVSIEIRNWWRKMLGLDTTVLEIMNAGTIEGLGKLAIISLKKKFGGPQENETNETSET